MESERVTYRSITQLYLIVLNLSLSAFYVGYALCYFNTIAFLDTTIIFFITADPALVQGFLTFCIPIGAAVGAYFSKYLLVKCSRKEYLLLVNWVIIVTTPLLQIKWFGVLLLVRVLQGGCVGLHSCICSLYIK